MKLCLCLMLSIAVSDADLCVISVCVVMPFIARYVAHMYLKALYSTGLFLIAAVDCI